MDDNFVVTCDNAKSYAIRVAGGNKKPLALIKCDRDCPTDNNRGQKLAQMLCDFLNGLDTETAASLLSEDMVTRTFKKKMKNSTVEDSTEETSETEETSDPTEVEVEG